MAFFRLDWWVQSPLGPSIPGCSVAILTDPSNFSTQPGTPLATIYAAGTSNSGTITGAAWAAQQIVFTLASVPADVVPGSYIAVAGASPSGYNSSLSAPWLVLATIGNEVIVQSFTNPGTWVSGGTVATSVLANPLTTDGSGHVFFYAAAAQYGLQVYGPTIFEQDYPDIGVGFSGGGGGGVSSVGLSAPAEFAVSGSPVTSSGTLSFTWNTENANLVLAGPATGVAATPGFRALVATDIPSLAYVTSVGFTMSGPSIFTFSTGGTPITGSGVITETIGLALQNANLVFAGPVSGSAAPPAFRPLTSSDLPGIVSPIKVENFNVTPATVNSSTSQTVLMTFTLPANELGTAQSLEIKASGTNAMANAETMTLQLYLDGNLIVQNISTSTGAAGSFGWEANGLIMLQSGGTGGFVEVSGDMSVALQGNIPLYNSQYSNPSAPVAFDTTATHVIQLTAQHSVSNAGNICVQRQMLVVRIG